MNALIIVGIVLGSIAGYVAVGWRLAKHDLPNAWARARADWHFDDTRRGSVKGQTVCMTLLWPIVLPVRGFSHRLDEIATHGDPAELKRQLDERADYIAKLERELGIGGGA